MYVAHTAVPGGAATSLRGLIRAFPRGSVTAQVVCPEGYAVAGLREVAEVHVVPGVSMVQNHTAAPLRGRRLATLTRSAWQLAFGRRLGALYDALRPDLVHLNDAGMFQAAALAKRRHIPVVMHIRCPADASSKRVNRILGAATGRWVDHAIAVDERVRDSWSGLAPRLPISVVYNPLQARYWLRAVQLMRNGAGAAAGHGATRSLRVALVSNLMSSKGVWDLLEAAQRLRDRRDLIFCLVGGNSRPAAFYDSLVGRTARVLGFVENVEADVRRWVRERHLEERVEVLGHVDDVGSVLERTDILVFPSHLDGVGRSVFEAGVYAVPAIVSMSTRADDIIRDGITGVVVPPKHPAALAEAIAKLASDATLRVRMGRAAQRQYLVQFSPRRSARRVLAVYEQVLRSQPR